MTTDSSYRDQIAAIENMLGLKLSAFDKFRSATEILITILDDNDFDQIENILKERQACINTINKLDVRIMEATENIFADYPYCFKTIASEFKSLSGALREIIHESININNKCLMAAEKHISALRCESLTGISHRHDFRYRQNQHSTEARFFNLNL